MPFVTHDDNAGVGQRAVTPDPFVEVAPASGGRRLAAQVVLSSVT